MAPGRPSSPAGRGLPRAAWRNDSSSRPFPLWGLALETMMPSGLIAWADGNNPVRDTGNIGAAPGRRVAHPLLQYTSTRNTSHSKYLPLGILPLGILPLGMLPLGIPPSAGWGPRPRLPGDPRGGDQRRHACASVPACCRYATCSVSTCVFGRPFAPFRTVRQTAVWCRCRVVESGKSRRDKDLAYFVIRGFHLGDAR